MGAALVLLLVALGAMAAGVLIGRYYVPDDRQLRRTARHSRAYMRALSHLLARDHDTVMAELRAVVEENVEDVEPYFALGALFRSRGEHERAIRVHQALTVRERDRKKLRHRAMYELGLDFRAAGMPRRATRALESVLAEEAGHEGALRALASLYEEQARFNDAAAMWQRLGRRRGEDLSHREHHLLVAAAQAALGRDDLDSAKQLLKAAQKHEESAHFFAAAAELAAARGNHRGARERLVQALTADPGLLPHLLPGLIAAEQQLLAHERMGRNGRHDDDLDEDTPLPPQLAAPARAALPAAGASAAAAGLSSTGSGIAGASALGAGPAAIGGAGVGSAGLSSAGGGIARASQASGGAFSMGGGAGASAAGAASSSAGGGIARASQASSGEGGASAAGAGASSMGGGAGASMAGGVASSIGGGAGASAGNAGAADVARGAASAVVAGPGVADLLIAAPLTDLSGSGASAAATAGASEAPVARPAQALEGDPTAAALAASSGERAGVYAAAVRSAGDAAGAGGRAESAASSGGLAEEAARLRAQIAVPVAGRGALTVALAPAEPEAQRPAEGVPLVPAQRPGATIAERVLALLAEVEADSGPRLEFALIRAQLVPPADAAAQADLARQLLLRFPDALAARVAAARLALTRGDAAAIRGALDGLVADGGALAWTLRGRWQCAHCGNRPGPFSWRCAQCRRWNTLRMETGIEPPPVPPRERRAATRPARGEGLAPDGALPAATLDGGLSETQLADAGVRRSLLGRVGGWFTGVWRRDASRPERG